MDTRRFLVAALGALALAGHVHAGVNAAITKLNEGGPSYLYTAQKINPGDSIHFQFPENDNPVCCARSRGSVVTLLSSDPDAVDYVSNRKLYRYRLSTRGISTSLPFIGIAVIGNNVSVAQRGDRQLRVRAGATATDLLLCTSQEGVHVVSRSNGKESGHLYLYLGYDIENPTCASSFSK